MSDGDLDVEKVRSPCVSICKLGSDGYCTGCFRHRSEISYWTSLSEEEKRKVVEESRQRGLERLKKD